MQYGYIQTTTETPVDLGGCYELLPCDQNTLLQGNDVLVLIGGIRIIVDPSCHSLGRSTASMFSTGDYAAFLRPKLEFAQLAIMELAKARNRHPKFESFAPSMMVIFDKMNDLYLSTSQPDAISVDGAKKACVQIAAMAQRFYEDLLSDK